MKRRHDWDTLRLTAAQREAAEGMIPVAYKIVITRRPRMAPDDVLGVAHMAAVKAAATHDPARAKLTTWVGWWVLAELNLEARRQARAARAMPFCDLACHEDFVSNLREMADPSENQADAAARAEETARLVGGLRARLPKREFEVLRLREIEGLTLAEVARRIGRSKQRVAQLEARAMQRLRGVSEGELLALGGRAA